MLFLYLDDSGKVHPSHPSRHVVFGGFAVDEHRWHQLVRQLSGAKGRYFPKRGSPHAWELKSKDFLTKNAWKRKKNRDFCNEVVAILERAGATMYAVAFEKAQASKPLTDSWAIPLCFQVLVAKFSAQVGGLGSTGTVVCDWSTHALDHHVSACVQSFVVSRKLGNIVGGVTYASSMADGPVQICDLIAGALRIHAEGGTHLDPFVVNLRGRVWRPVGLKDVEGKPVQTEVRLF